MTDAECVPFLQWALPRLGLRWAGFRKPRRQVRRRLTRRLEALALDDLGAYRRRLEDDPAEWGVLDGLCRISISRFYRDRGVFDRLRDEVLPGLAAVIRGGTLRCLSAGCASGEEPYTLAILWREALRTRFPELSLEVVALDADPHMLERARAAIYPPSSLEDLPPAWRARCFVAESSDPPTFRLDPTLREVVSLRQGDLRRDVPGGPFQLILCRNLAFTYFAPEGQRQALECLLDRLAPGGALVVGRHEAPPEPSGLAPLRAGSSIYTRRATS